MGKDLWVGWHNGFWYIFYKNSRFNVQGYISEQAAKESHYYKHFKELIG